MASPDRTPALVVSLLGGFAVRDEAGNEATGPWRRPGARAVVKLLALSPGHRRGRAELMANLWPDASPESANSRLRVALHAVRHTFEPDLAARANSGYLWSRETMVGLTDAVRVDVDTVRASAADALASGAPAELAAVVVDLGHDLLPEDPDAPWADPARRELARLRRRATLALAESPPSADPALEGQVESLLESGLVDDESDEELTRALMERWAAAGRESEAARIYHRLVEVLRSELGTTPSAETTDLMARIAPDRVQQRRVGPLPVEVRRLTAGGIASLPDRDRALDALTGRLGEGVDDAGLLVLSGEAGVGKSVAAAHLGADLARAGTTVLWGAAHRVEGPSAYGPVTEAIREYVANAPADVRQRLLADLDALGGLLDRAETSDHPPDRVFHDVRSFLDRLPPPTLLVLDDLHDVDQPTRQLVHRLLRARVSTRFLATVRDEPAAEQDADGLGDLLTALSRQGLTTRVELMGLSYGDCRALIRHRNPELDDVDAERVYELSGGNPLFAAELSDSTGAGDSTGALPDSLRTAIGARLDTFAGPALGVLAVVAVCAGPVTVREVATVAGAGLNPPVASPQLDEAIDELVRARVIDEVDLRLDGLQVDGLALRHPLFGLAVTDSLSKARLRRIHAACAEALQSFRPEALESIARHLDAADDPSADEWLVRAARRSASLYADDVADRLYALLHRRRRMAGRAAADAPDLVDDEVAWADCLMRQARYGEARAILEELLVRPPQDPELAGRVRGALAEALARGGQVADSAAVLATSTDRQPIEWLVVAELGFTTGDYRGALAAVDQSGVLDSDEDASEFAGRAAHVRSVSLLMLDDVDGADGWARRALETGERIDDPVVCERSMSTLRELAFRAGRSAEALRWSRRTHAVLERIGDPLAQAFERANLALLQLALGDDDRARRTAASAVRLARAYAGNWSLPFALLALSEVGLKAETPDLEAARALAIEATGLVAAGSYAEASAARLLAECDIADGRPDAALARLGEADSPADQVVRVAAELELQVQPDVVVQRARQALQAVRGAGDRALEPEARRVLAEALRCAGDEEAAETELLVAAAAAEAAGQAVAARRVKRTRERWETGW